MGENQALEVKLGKRFEFGPYWERFLTILNEDKIKPAVQSLQAILGLHDLKGKTEATKPEEIFSFFQKREFVLRKLKTCGGRMGCNEFVFEEGP